MQTDEVNAPRIGDGGEWSFLGGVWADGPDGELSPPESGGEPNFAVLHGREYSDVDMRCRFKFRWGHGGARLLFRVQDSMRYYALDIPWCGQQNRNRHFWAGIVLADGTPLQRYLNLGLVTGICPEHERWYQARVQCVGSRIRAWIDGRPVADIEDRTLAAGRMGLMGEATAGHGTPVFADVQVAGQEVGPSPWQGLAAPPKHWITPCPEVDPETYQGYPSMVKSNSGALMVSLPFHDPNGGPPPRRVVWVRSSDGGRTWSEPEEPTLPAGLGGVFVKQDGTWACVHRDVPGMGLEGMVMFESRDEGKTWSDAGPLKIVGELLEDFPPEAGPSGRPVRLRDGALVAPLFCGVDHGKPPYEGGHVVSTNFVIRSTDDGATWSAPVRCDRNNAPDQTRWHCPGNFSEMGMAEAADNVVMGFGRPGPWPYMWQVLSRDGGKSWEPAAFAPFPGYCSSLTSTASGALVAVHRFPYLAANLSYDGGITWDAGTIIDYPTWANQHALEVEPDVVFVLYMGHIIDKGQPDVRAIRLRVTGEGLKVDY